MTEETLVKTLLSSRSRLQSRALIIVRDTHLAEDIFQEVMVRALQQRDCFESAQSLMAWTHTAIRNLSIDYVRRLGRLNGILSNVAVEAVEYRMDRLAQESGPREEAMKACLERLPDESKNLLHLRYDKGKKGHELACMLQRNENAVYKTLSRLHLALKRCIEDRLNHSGVSR